MAIKRASIRRQGTKLIRSAPVEPPKLPQKSSLAPASKPRQAAQSPPECWRVMRVAKLLDVSRKRVYQLVQERRLEVIRLGPRQMRVLKSSIERYIGRLLEEELERDY